MASDTLPGADPATRRFYHPELDGLRFLAFFFVFFHHFYPGLPFSAGQDPPEWWRLLRESGALGVDLFFCLSGFLITRLLLLEERKTGTVAVGHFYLRRILRIWPLYYAFLALIVYLGSLGWEAPMGGFLWPFLLLVGNWACAFSSFFYNSAAPLWSVCLEEQFYLVWPLVVRRLGARRVASAAFVMIGSSIFYRILLALFDIPYPATWTMTLTRLDSLAAGILVAVLLGDRIPSFSAARRGLLFVGGLLLWIGVVGIWPLADDPTLGAAILGYPAIAAGAASMLLAALVPSGGSPGLLARQPLVFLGRISYGLYVFHMVALNLVRRFWPEAEPSSWTVGIAALVLTIAVATLSYYLLERPFLLLKEKYAAIRSRPA